MPVDATAAKPRGEIIHSLPTATAVEPFTPDSDTFKKDQSLKAGECLRSEGYKACLQEDGNFVLSQTKTKSPEETWEKMHGAATEIAADSSGIAWVVNKIGGIFQFNGKQWTMYNKDNMRAKDIGVGPNGEVWIISNRREGQDGENYAIYQWVS